MPILSEESRRACGRSLVRPGQNGRRPPALRSRCSQTELVLATCSDGTAHELTEYELVAACSTGRSWAVCGAEITLAPLVALPGKRCMGCAAVLNPPPARREPGPHPVDASCGVGVVAHMRRDQRLLRVEKLAARRPVGRWCPMTECRMIMAGLVGLCVLAATSGLWHGADEVCTLVIAGLGACGVVAAVAVAVRRELRIRRRMSAIRLGPAADRVSLVSVERVAS